MYSSTPDKSSLASTFTITLSCVGITFKLPSGGFLSILSITIVIEPPLFSPSVKFTSISVFSETIIPVSGL